MTNFPTSPPLPDNYIEMRKNPGSHTPHHTTLHYLALHQKCFPQLSCRHTFFLHQNLHQNVRIMFYESAFTADAAMWFRERENAMLMVAECRTFLCWNVAATRCFLSVDTKRIECNVKVQHFPDFLFKVAVSAVVRLLPIISASQQSLTFCPNKPLAVAVASCVYKCLENGNTLVLLHQ